MPVTIEGLEVLKKSLAPSRIKKQLALSIADETLRFHKTLQTAVLSKYNAPKKLNSVLKGGSISNVVFGKNILRTGLVYKYKSIPLHKFPFQETGVSATSKFILFHSEKRFTSRIKKESLGVIVTVKKNSPKLMKRGFILDPRRRNTGSKPWQKSNPHRFGIYSRDGEPTWTGASLGSPRTSLKALFGPSLSEMAFSVFKTDVLVKKALKEFEENVTKNLIL